MATWTIRTYYKKSCEQIEYFYNRKNNDKIIVRDGFRRAEFIIYTTDNEFPQFEFDEVPGGDGKRDSIDLFSLVAGATLKLTLKMKTKQNDSVI